ncbi:MAG TPA: hypothetical protein VHI52_15175, partial [Verrucomicrobiae bacterium]|nr:hypothetical protein [Verrucomicrobiae bacterium]
FGLRLQRQKPELVFTCGFAGGLRPGVRRGTVLFSDAAGTGLEEDLRKAGAVPARFHASASVITSPLEKRDLFSSTGADAVEMESFAIAALCRECRLPCVTVRVVLDEAEEKLPLDFNQVLTEDLRISPGKLALELLKSPGKIGALMRLGKQSGFAAKQLAEVLGQVLCCSR